MEYNNRPTKKKMICLKLDFVFHVAPKKKLKCLPASLKSHNRYAPWILMKEEGEEEMPESSTVSVYFQNYPGLSFYVNDSLVV